MYDAQIHGYDAVLEFSEPTYDSNGNTLTKVDSTGTTQYFWDFENRLASVTLPGTGGAVTFKYDPFGRRIYKSSSSGTSIFAYDGNKLIEETNSSGAVVARYSQGFNIDEPLAMLRSATTSYYHADGLGSVTSLSSSAGSLAQTYGYDSFGKQTSSSGSLTNPFQYTAREFDPETNLYFYRARYYAPVLGRFLSEDPLRFKVSADYYSYVWNRPLVLRDPFGMDPIDDIGYALCKAKCEAQRALLYIGCFYYVLKGGAAEENCFGAANAIYADCIEGCGATCRHEPISK
jgi:RHS repeat-associated protein